MRLLTSGYNTQNPPAGIAIGYYNTPNSTGTLINAKNGKGDSFTVDNRYGLTKERLVFKTDSSDSIHLEGQWQVVNHVKDKTSGVTGNLYMDNQGNKVLISGGANVLTEKVGNLQNG